MRSTPLLLSIVLFVCFFVSCESNNEIIQEDAIGIHRYRELENDDIVKPKHHPKPSSSSGGGSEGSSGGSGSGSGGSGSGSGGGSGGSGGSSGGSSGSSSGSGGGSSSGGSATASSYVSTAKAPATKTHHGKKMAALSISGAILAAAAFHQRRRVTAVETHPLEGSIAKRIQKFEKFAKPGMENVRPTGKGNLNSDYAAMPGTAVMV